MVALSPAACEELGIALSEEDRARPYIEMSGRKGLGVKADDLIDQLEAGALKEVEKRNADLSAEALKATAHEVAVAALRYFLLKFTRNTVIAFDFKEALSFEGETGPYCQYAAVRAGSIFRKLDEQTQRDAAALLEAPSDDVRERIAHVLKGEIGTQNWYLVMLKQQLDEVIAQSRKSAEPANLAKYTFSVARGFSRFYQRDENRIVTEKDDVRRAVLIAVTQIVRAQLTAALAILGIRVPEQM
jgi:arginyl-tRNA synthetase